MSITIYFGNFLFEFMIGVRNLLGVNTNVQVEGMGYKGRHVLRKEAEH